MLITHDEDIAQYSKRVARMRDGRILSDTTRHDLGEAGHDGPGGPRLRAALVMAVRGLRANWQRSLPNTLGMRWPAGGW
jgi:hypothetical protein